MLYEASGKVLVVGKTQTFGSNGFQKREIVLEIGEPDSKWKDTVSFEFVKDKTVLLDGVSVGDTVQISFAIGGRSWADPKTGQTRYFTSLKGIKISGGSGKAAKTPTPAVPDAGVMDEPDGMEMPF